MLRYILCQVMLMVSLVAFCVPQWALPRVPVAIVRSAPRHSAEQVSQVVMGTPLKLLADKGDWWKVQTPDGYEGFIRSNTLVRRDQEQMEHWRQSQRIIILADHNEYVTEYATNVDGENPRVSIALPGSIMEVTSESDSVMGVRLPGGETGYVTASVCIPLAQWANMEYNPEAMSLYALRMMGAPYVWGGTNINGMDCSGLSLISAYQQGVILPRDAAPQSMEGEKVDPENFRRHQAGDLLFFGDRGKGLVNHVGIALGGGDYVHSSGRVRISSLDPSSPRYEDSGLIRVRRLNADDAVRLSAKRLGWYF